MSKWMVYSKRADFNAIGQIFQIDPVVARIIRNRDVVGEEAIQNYLHGTKEDMYSPHQMKDMDKAVALIKEKIDQKKNIRIIGDYDIDGVTSLYILIKALSACGADAEGEIPHRMKDGYGINERLIQEAYEAGCDTLITCDNGISAIEQIAYAKRLGMTVIITDHHEIPYEEIDGVKHYRLPIADAVVNPKQEDCPYPFKHLCGAGVAYKLALALYEAYGFQNEEAEKFLEYAAIGTVGDVMDLQDENRIIVKEGLKLLRKTENLGLKALIEVNGIYSEHLNAYHIGFVIGPCLNAGGRLDTAKRALSLLLAEKKTEADNTAGELKALNDSRKEMTKKGVGRAVAQIENSELAKDHVLVVYLEDCHESLAGIIAGRLRELYHKPAFVLTKGEEGIKGSGRSIEAYSMFEELVKAKEYLEKFGGHPMAAGLSLKGDCAEQFRQNLNEQQTLTADDLVETIWIDVPMPIDYVTEPLIRQLSVLEPFGKGNEKPVFADKHIRILEKKVIGKNQNAVRLMLMDSKGNKKNGIYFGDGLKFMEEIQEVKEVSILYYPSLNEYRGSIDIQIVVVKVLVEA